MISTAEVKRWINTLEKGSSIAIDEGGLCLEEFDKNDKKTGAYLEIGGETQHE